MTVVMKSIRLVDTAEDDGNQSTYRSHGEQDGCDGDVRDLLHGCQLLLDVGVAPVYVVDTIDGMGNEFIDGYITEEHGEWLTEEEGEAVIVELNSILVESRQMIVSRFGGAISIDDSGAVLIPENMFGVWETFKSTEFNAIVDRAFAHAHLSAIKLMRDIQFEIISRRLDAPSIIEV